MGRITKLETKKTLNPFEDEYFVEDLISTIHEEVPKIVSFPQLQENEIQKKMVIGLREMIVELKDDLNSIGKIVVTNQLDIRKCS